MARIILSEVFSPDGAFVVEDSDLVNEGYDAVRHFMVTFDRHPIAHHTTNLVVTVDDDGQGASAMSKCLAPNRDGTFSFCDYLDRLVRTDSGWRLQRRTVRMRARNWSRS